MDYTRNHEILRTFTYRPSHPRLIMNWAYAPPHIAIFDHFQEYLDDLIRISLNQWNSSPLPEKGKEPWQDTELSSLKFPLLLTSGRPLPTLHLILMLQLLVCTSYSRFLI